MRKFIFMAACCLLLTACKSLAFSYPPEKFHSMNSAEFATYVERYSSDADKIFAVGFKAIKHPAPNETILMAPRIVHSLGTDGRLVARRRDSGETEYAYYVLLQYQEDFLRRYDSVRDVSGTKLNFETLAAYRGNGGFHEEIIKVELSEDKLLEAKFDDLLITLAAREHERRIARASTNLLSQVSQNVNDNFDLEVPSNYIANFMEAVNRQ